MGGVGWERVTHPMSRRTVQARGEARTQKNSASPKQKKPGACLQAREPSKRAVFFLGSCLQ